MRRAKKASSIAAAGPLAVAVDHIDDGAAGQPRRRLLDHLLKDPRVRGAAGDLEADRRQRLRGCDGDSGGFWFWHVAFVERPRLTAAIRFWTSPLPHLIARVRPGC